MTRDTLSEVLRSVRLEGAVFYYVQGEGTWTAEQPASREIAAMIMPRADHVMMYHVVTRGSCWCAVAGQKPVELQAGDVVVFARGDPHVMSSAPGLRGAVDLGVFDVERPHQMPFLLTRRGQTITSTDLSSRPGDCTLVCGYFGCDARPFNPLLSSLPPLLHVRSDAADDGWISQFIRFAVAESSSKRPGGEALLERLSETMFVEVLRRYLDALPDGQSGWLAGLRDRYVGRALALIHQAPAQEWTTGKLSEQVGISRSVLSDRFTELIGRAPMHYLTDWRMQVASGLLRRSSANIASVALEVGYRSEAAFSRAFHRAVGASPAQWRRQHHMETRNRATSKSP